MGFDQLGAQSTRGAGQRIVSPRGHGRQRCEAELRVERQTLAKSLPAQCGAGLAACQLCHLRRGILAPHPGEQSDGNFVTALGR